MPSISEILGQQGQANPSNMMVLSNTEANKLNNAALWVSGETGSILIDSGAHKRISWNDSDGSLAIRSGNYVSSTGNVYAKGLLDLSSGAATLTLDTDNRDGSIELKVAPIGASGDLITYSNTFKLSVAGATINNSAIVTENNLKTINGNTVLGSGDIAISAVPNQSGNTGKYLTTNGTIASWKTLGTVVEKNIAVSGDASSTEVVLGSDTRLTNARTPVSHTHAISEITSLVSTLSNKVDVMTITTTSVNKTMSANEICVVLANDLGITPPAVVNNAKFGVVIPAGITGIYINGTGTIVAGVLDDSQVLLDLYSSVVSTYMFRYNSTTGWTLE